MASDLDLGVANLEPEQTWDDLPHFATAQHSKLFKQVQIQKQTLEKLRQEAGENQERISIMGEHLKNVKAEVSHTQTLCDAKVRDIEGEEHIKQLADREIGRIRSDVVKTNKFLQDFQDKLSNVQNTTYQSNEKLEQFKLQMNYNQEALEQWALAAKQKDEDSLALAKYMRSDDERIKTLNIQIEKISGLAQERRRALESEVTETQAAQIELDRTAEEFRTLHLERQQLIKQWDDAVKAMARRDQVITQLAEHIAQTHHDISLLESELVQQRDFLSREVSNNKQSGTAILVEERKTEKLRLQLNDEEQSEVALRDVLDVQRSELGRVVADAHRSVSAVAALSASLDQRSTAVENAREKLVAAQQRLKQQQNEALSWSDRAENADRYFVEQKAELRAVEREEESLKETMFKHSQELFRQRTEEASLVSTISGTQATSRNLQASVNLLDQRSLKQQEMLYNIEFRVQQLQRKVSRADGKRSQEETVILNKRIAELQALYDERLAEVQMLQTQCKRVQDDGRAVKREVGRIEEERSALTAKIGELQLENDSAQSQVKVSTRNKEEIVVQHDLLKLEIQRLSTLLHTKADQVIGLENRKVQLQLSMEERLKDVEQYRELQRLELKTNEEDRHTVTMELNERLLKVEKLKQKYASVAGQMQGLDSEEHTQAFYIINAAQERQELQREGDSLNEAIKVAEKEIRLLQRTLVGLTEKNLNFRASFQRLELESDEVRDQMHLEEEQQVAKTQLLKKRSYLREIATDFEERRRLVTEITAHTQGLRQQVDTASREFDQVQKTVDEQHLKLERALQAATQRQSQLRRARKVAPDTESVEEVDIRLLEIQHKNKTLLNFLLNFVEGNPHLEHTVHDAMQAVGLSFPSQPPSVSSRASSIASLRSLDSPPDARAKNRVTAPLASVQIGSNFGLGSTASISSAGGPTRLPPRPGSRQQSLSRPTSSRSIISESGQDYGAN